MIVDVVPLNICGVVFGNVFCEIEILFILGEKISIDWLKMLILSFVQIKERKILLWLDQAHIPMDNLLFYF